MSPKSISGTSKALKVTKAEMPPEEPLTLEDWFWRIRQYEDSIFVREPVNGKFGAVALGGLSPKRWAYWVTRFFHDGANPVRMIRESGRAK
jgi:hypothetical protein